MPNRRELEQKAKSVLERWINMKKEQGTLDDKNFYIRGKSISAEDLVREIYQETSIGKQYMNSLIELGQRYGFDNLS